MIDLDEIRKEIAITNNILLDKNDPAMWIVILFGKLLEQSVDTLNAQQEANLKSLLNALQQGNTEAKNTARRVINEATSHVSDQVHVAVTSAIDKGRENIRKELEYAWENIEKSRKAAMFWAVVSGLFAAFTAGKFFIA